MFPEISSVLRKHLKKYSLHVYNPDLSTSNKRLFINIKNIFHPKIAWNNLQFIFDDKRVCISMNEMFMTVFTFFSHTNYPLDDAWVTTA